MANLRIDDTRRVAPGQAPGQFAAPDASRGADFASRQLQQTGQAVQQAGQVAANIYTAEREKFNETRVNEALNRAQAVALENQTEMSQLLGAAAMKVGENEQPVDVVYNERFGRQVGEIADELQLTAEQRRRYTEQVQPLTTRFSAAATGHFAAQATAYQEDVETTTVATAQMAIFAAPDDPEVYTENSARIAAATAASGRRMGWTAERTALEVQERTGKAVLDVVIARADEDPRGAQDLLDRRRDDMTPAQQAAARNATAGGLATQDASAWVSTTFAGAPPAPAGTPGASFQMPLDGVSLPGPGDRDYGPRGSFRTSNGRQASTVHDGTDFSAPAGSPVRAVAGGRVVRAGPNGGYGNFVEIDHGNGVVVGYAHLQDFDVAVGDTVAPGQNFGRVGSTGNSTGPHLHLRARRNGVSVNPAELFGEESDAAAAAPQTGGTRPTRAAMERMATERFGTTPVQLQAARAEIARVYSLDAAEKAEQERNALAAAYRYMEQNRAAPPASIMANLPPGSVNTVNNYLEALIAPPTVRSDPAILMAIAANPSAITEMSPEEIVATYGRNLSSNDLISLIGTSARASTAAVAEAQKATVVPQQAFSSAWSASLDASGIDRTPAGRTADSDRQALAQINAAVREEVVERQRTLGRQMNREEIAAVIENRLGRLAWERPQGMLQPYATGFQTSYETMIRPNQLEYRRLARERLGRNPTDAEIFNEYVNNRIRGN
jgi:murein DD-endopeptidase MepM/ murein hydrolase activator NlpD